MNSFNSIESKVNPNQVVVKCTALSLPESTEYVVRVKKKTIPEQIPAFGLLCALIGMTIGLILKILLHNLLKFLLGVTMFSLASLIVKVLTELHSIEVLVFR